MPSVFGSVLGPAREVRLQYRLGGDVHKTDCESKQSDPGDRVGQSRASQLLWYGQARYCRQSCKKPSYTYDNSERAAHSIVGRESGRAPLDDTLPQSHVSRVAIASIPTHAAKIANPTPTKVRISNSKGRTGRATHQ